MELIINDLPQHGVLIHGPESPGYRERLLALPAAFTALPDIDDDELRYSVIVENQTPQHIVKISLSWSPYPRESGTPISQGVESSYLLEFNNLWRNLIPAGTQCAWSALDGLRFMNQKRSYPKGGDNQRKERDDVKKRLAANDKWSVDINYVLFGNGVFAGPDTDLEFDQDEAKNRGRVDMFAGLNQKLDKGEDIFAHVEGYALITRPQIEALYPDARAILPNLEQLYAISKKSAAMNVINRRQKFGELATVEWIRESAKSHIPLVRR